MKILFTGGGTAGHVNPALAVAGYIKASSPRQISGLPGPKALEDGWSSGRVTHCTFPLAGLSPQIELERHPPECGRPFQGGQSEPPRQGDPGRISADSGAGHGRLCQLPRSAGRRAPGHPLRHAGSERSARYGGQADEP